MKTIAIVGASGGIGAAMLEELSGRDDVANVHGTFFRTMPEASTQATGRRPAVAQVQWTQVDVQDEEAIKAWMGSLGKIDWLINCVGYLHDDKHGPEKSIAQIDPEHFANSMAVNCLPTLLLGKYARTGPEGFCLWRLRDCIGSRGQYRGQRVGWAGTAIEPRRRR